MPAAANASDPRPDEWAKARSTIDAADEHLSDLRKYGLSFIATLLTAQGITEVSVGQPNAYITPSVKLGITIASLLLILAMVVIERVDRSIQRAAALRAVVLERELGMELTEDIAALYRRYNVDAWVNVLYAMFVLAAGGLGAAILNPTALNFAWETWADFLATTIVLVLVLVIGFHRPDRLIDWSLDRYRVVKGTPVVLTLTNISPAILYGKPEDDLWKVDRVVHTKGLCHEWKDGPAEIGAGESKSWVIDTGKLTEGAFDLVVRRTDQSIWWFTKRVELNTSVVLPVQLVVTNPPPAAAHHP